MGQLACGLSPGPSDISGAFLGPACLRFLLTFYHSIICQVVAVVNGSPFHPVLLTFPGCVSSLFKILAVVDVDIRWSDHHGGDLARTQGELRRRPRITNAATYLSTASPLMNSFLRLSKACSRSA